MTAKLTNNFDTYNFLTEIFINTIKLRQVTIEHHLNAPDGVYLAFYQEFNFIHRISLSVMHILYKIINKKDKKPNNLFKYWVM